MKNIQHIILDIDGVLIGEKSPYPSDGIMRALKSLKQNGIHVHLCTAKPAFAIQDIITGAGLNDYHITDGGGALIDPVGDKILEESCIQKEVLLSILEDLQKSNIYTEIYTRDEYYIEAGMQGEITQKHRIVLQKYPELIDNLHDPDILRSVIKIMPIVEGEQERGRVEGVFSKYLDKLHLAWGVHPVILPLQFGIITNKGISKGEASKKILESYSGNFEDTLAVGDSLSDWDFIQHCKYKGAMGNAGESLKKLVHSDQLGFVGCGVDEDGLLDILKHFRLI